MFCRGSPTKIFAKLCIVLGVKCIFKCSKIWLFLYYMPITSFVSTIASLNVKYDDDGDTMVHRS